MKTITVKASGNYDVLIGKGLLQDIGERIQKTLNRTCTIAVISDSNVYPIYGSTILEQLNQSGFRVVNFVFPAGESSKNPNTYIEILNFLATNQVTRSDGILALGGGVVGDISGFAAATYLRGIAYIQVPTTLLAMVDSSVGGKTAIDLPAGKNLVGAFYQPRLVVCDLNTLDTLPESVFCDGCAEVIKYGILYDAGLFDHLDKNGLNFDREAVVSRCVELKRNVVSEDEFDTGARQMLNLGHTIGHGIETQSSYTFTHGQAVAIGMAIVAKSACQSIYPQLISVLKKFKLPVNTTFTAKQLFQSALSDKKRSGGIVNLIIPEAIGKCNIIPTAVEQLEAFIEEGL